ncbi:MAG: type I-E CRISPR-associated protein Cse1/CasA [Methanomicrobiaceae archaeon]|nr:type I-E CRISPR-associated protein Cse1/CasA [Methanomicrobiaceae archaeon]
MYADGTEDVIAPFEIFVLDIKTAVSSFNAPRPDFNGSLIQFMIGLVQTTMAPEDEGEWDEFIENPPDETEVKKAFDSVSDAFNLNGTGYRFMQDVSVKDSESTFGLENLIPSLPANGFFQKTDNLNGICPVCAAMSLFTLQLNGPSMGRGHKTGLRGGGPLTTVVLGKNIPQTIMLNVLPESQFYNSMEYERKSSLNNIFPWMGQVPTSEKKGTGILTPDNSSELQMFWGMGLRLFLDYENLTSGTCDICGAESNALIHQSLVKPYGIAYENWHHTLTPYYKSSGEDDSILPSHLSPSGISYSNWLGLTQNAPDGNKKAARVVNWFYENNNFVKEIFDLSSEKARLWAFGYDYSNAKARCWYESRMPIYLLENNLRNDYENHVAQIVNTANYVQKILHGCVKESWYGKNAPGGNVPDVSSRFWNETEPFFYDILDKLIFDLKSGNDPSGIKIEWLKKIRSYSLEEIFDFYSQSQYMDSKNPKRILSARKSFQKMTYPKSGSKISKELGLSLEAAP